MALALGSVFMIGALTAIIGVVTVIVMLFLMRPEALPALVSRPLSWSLELPGGLPAATAKDLFDEGVDHYGQGNNADALQNFYRALTADPTNASAEKFSLAAGELLVLDALTAHKDEAVADRKRREAERDKLLRDAKRSGRTGRAARAALEKEHRDDPVVVDALGLKKRKEVLELEASLAQAADLSASQEYTEAIEHYRKVLDESRDATLRKTAAAGLRLCERELAHSVAVPWSEAVMLEATGQPGAKAKFEEILSLHPTNPSAKLHIDRLER